MFYFWRGATAALVPGFLCQSGRRRPENVSILSSLMCLCSKALKPFGRIPEPPLDIVLVTQLKREFMHDGQKREKMGNAYFHLDRKCLASKVLAFDPSLVDVPNTLSQQLTQSHKLVVLYSLGIDLRWVDFSRDVFQEIIWA